MLIRFVHRFACTPQTYWEATRDPAYEERIRSRAEVDVDVLEAREAPPRSFMKARVSPRRELPALVQKAIGAARLSYVQEVESDASTLTTRWRVVSDFLTDRVKCSGTSRVTPVPEGCERLIEGNIEVQVPVVGGSIEKQIVGEIERSWDRAADVMREFLVSRGG